MKSISISWLNKQLPFCCVASLRFRSVLCLLISSAILWSLSAKAQSVKLAYYGETLVHYGLKAGLDYPLAEKIKHKTNGHSIQKAFLFSPALTLYHHFQNHTGLIISPEFGYRRTGKAGGMFEVALSPSYFRYFLSGITYELTPEGTFKKVPLAGRNTFLPTFSVGLGKDLSVKHDLPFAWYTRLNLSVQYPYNASFLPRFAFEAGVIKKISTIKLFTK